AEKPENFVGVSVHRHELRHRLAMFGDHHSLALGLDLVHDGETVGFECSCGNCFHSPTREPEFRLWSLYHSHSRVFLTGRARVPLVQISGERVRGFQPLMFAILPQTSHLRLVLSSAKNIIWTL